MTDTLARTGVPQTLVIAQPVGDVVLPITMSLVIDDTTLDWAPTVLSIYLTGAPASTDVIFAIDGTDALTITSNTAGNVGPATVSVSTDYLAGTHTLTARADGAGEVSATFTLTYDPAAPPAVPGFDSPPQQVTGTLVGTVRRWVLQDLAPDGLGSWIMPLNPVSMAPLPIGRTLTPLHSTDVLAGQFQIFEPLPIPQQWSFAGYCPDEAFHDQLVAYAGLNRRFYLIDHRNRAWTISCTGVDLVPRKRTQLDDGTYNDWVHDYTFNAYLYDQAFAVPVHP